MGEKHTKKTLVIDKNSIFKSKIESGNDYENSFFSEAYKKAEKCLDEIINFRKSESNNMNKRNENNDINDFNNIIAFVGDRGSGKTSTMKSFRNNLVKDEKQSKYTLLDIIDPMLFSNNDSIIEIIVAQMFKKFKDKKCNDNLLKKKELAKKFENVHKDLKMLNTNKSKILEQSYDNLEALIDLSSAISLKTHIEALIKDYLDYEGNSSNDGFLVISIDDLDMNLKVGEKMLEDIRKYLVLPNVVILMAIKFEQLEEVVSQKFAKDLIVNLKIAESIKRQLEFKNGIDDKTEKYLEKLIPFSRRVHMPNILVENFKVKIDDLDNIYVQDKNGDTVPNIINYNLNKKIGYSIITKDHYKAIVPQNLRFFIDFIVTLNTMSNVEDKDSIMENIAIFKEYIKAILISNIRDTDKRNQLTGILECNFDKLNGKALFYLNRCINSYKNENYELIDVVNERVSWLNENQLKVNDTRIQYGDIITWVKMLQLTEANVITDNSVEIFKCIYSIRLLEKFYSDPLMLFKETGFNFIGHYFALTGNYRGSSIFQEVEIKNKEIFKGEDNRYYDFIIPIFNIIFDKYKGDHSYNRLLRREKKEYIIEKEHSEFDNFELMPLNIVSYSMYKEVYKQYIEHYTDSIGGVTKKQIVYLNNELNDINNNENFIELQNKYSLIINLDFWMKILQTIDSMIQLSNGADPIGTMFKNLNSVNEVFNKICQVYNIQHIEKSDNIISINIGDIDDDLEKFIQEFPNEYNKLKHNSTILINIKYKEGLNKVLHSIGNTRKYLEQKLKDKKLRTFNNTCKGKLKDIDVEEFSEDTKYKKYRDDIFKSIEEVDTRSEAPQDKTINQIIGLLDNFRRYIEHIIAEIGKLPETEENNEDIQNPKEFKDSEEVQEESVDDENKEDQNIECIDE